MTQIMCHSFKNKLLNKLRYKMSKLISVEGTDLAGKSSVIIPYLKSKLGEDKFDYYSDLKTGDLSSSIREIFMDHNLIQDSTDWRTIAFLVSAARSDIVKKYIEPSLQNKKNVIVDRYVDTSFVYNLKSDIAPIDTILNLSTHLIYPDIVIFAYCSYEEMVKRKHQRSEENNDQWDISSREEHDNIFYRYKSRLHSANKTVIEIDTSVSIEDTYRQLDEKLISKYFK